MDTITLESVNVLPKKTWNYLQINDCKIKVEAPAGPASCTPDSSMAHLQTGAGPEAAQYIFQAASARRSIRIDANTIATEPLCVDVDDSCHIASTDIYVGSGSKVCIVISAHAKQQGNYTLANGIRIIADHDADITLLNIVDTPCGTTYLENAGISLGDRCNFQAHMFYLGEGDIVAGCAVTSTGADAKFEATTRYFVPRRRRLDLNYIADVYGERSHGDFTASGILLERSKKTLRQTIDLHKGCKGSDGGENETVLLVGDRITNKTIPTILCHEDEVAGNHGATIGSISPDQLRYLTARGLSKKEITALFANSIIEEARRIMPEATKAAAIAGNAASKIQTLFSEQA